jgi:hypothetical protein
VDELQLAEHYQASGVRQAEFCRFTDPRRGFHRCRQSHGQQLNMIENVYRKLVLLIACVQRRLRLEQQNRNLLLRNWAVLHTPRDDYELAFFDPFLSITEIDPEPPGDDKEQLVFILMVVPDEFALEFDQLHELAIETSDDLRPPVFAKQAEFFPNIYLMHKASPRTQYFSLGDRVPPRRHILHLCSSEATV